MTTSRRDTRAAHPDVLAWRHACLLAAGVAPPLAHDVAADRRYDLHALIGLLERGCPPAVAARILAPLDAPEAPT